MHTSTEPRAIGPDEHRPDNSHPDDSRALIEQLRESITQTSRSEQLGVWPRREHGTCPMDSPQSRRAAQLQP